MKHIMRYGGAVALLLCLAVPVNADMRLFSPTTLPAEVNAIVNNEISAAFPGATFSEAWLTDQFSDAGIHDLPPTNWDRLRLLNAGVDVEGKNELGLIFTFTSPKPFDKKFTHGSKNMDNLLQFLLRGARGDASIRLMSSTVLAQRTLPDYLRAALWVKITIPKGGYNPVRRDIVYRPEHADSMAAIRLALARHDMQLNDHNRRIKMVEDRPISVGLDRSALGLAFGAGFTGININGDSYTGPTAFVDGRYLAAKITVGGGQAFDQTTDWEQYGDLTIPAIKDNHFEFANVAYAWSQRGQYGRYGAVGLMILHAQDMNYLNDSKRQGYAIGLSGTLALPLPVATPEVWGMVGYGRSIHSSETYGVPGQISEGLSTVIGARLTFGYR